MASRGGPRAAGTDGTDFSHRETIKAQYYVRNGQRSNSFRQRKTGLRYNDDPGLHSDEDEEEISRLYRDDDIAPNNHADLYNEQEKQELFEELRQSRQFDREKHGEDNNQCLHDGELPLTGDYHGMGGPHSVPLITTGAFERPQTEPHRNCLLDELYLAPSPDQIKAFKKIEKMKENAINKSRLKWAITFHFLLALIMVAKLLPDILDRVDIFILELEELYIPKPRLWEWLWLSSVLFCYFGITACRRSTVSSMQLFIFSVAILGLAPVAFALGIHVKDVYAYASTKSTKDLEMWKGYPVALYWFVFLAVALQVHCVQLYFGMNLIKAWRPKRKTQ